MTDKRKKNRKHLIFYKLKKKKKSLTENQTQVTTAALKKKRLTAPFSVKQIILRDRVSLLFDFPHLLLLNYIFNLVTALFFVHIIFQ